MSLTMAIGAAKRVFVKYPVTRGILTYCVLWPASNIVEQGVIARKKRWDPMETLRYGIYGGFWSAPAVYCWMRLASRFWPQKTLRHGLTKALVEQLTYSPFSLVTFYLGMTLMEGKGWNAAVAELKAKFFSTYTKGVCYWPVVQTVNFTFIPERNRAPVVGFFSFLWAIFLSYKKHLDVPAEQQ